MDYNKKTTARFCVEKLFPEDYAHRSSGLFARILLRKTALGNGQNTKLWEETLCSFNS